MSVLKSVLLVLLLRTCLFTTGYAQSKKFTHSLSDYNITLEIDPAKWLRVTYRDLAPLYNKHKIDFDKYLEEQTGFIALFIYKPMDSINLTDQVSITIEVDTIKPSVYTPLSIRDSIQSHKPFLKGLRGGQMDKNTYGTNYYDKTTNSVISKNSTVTITFGQPATGDPVRHYLVTQTKVVGRYRVLIEYRCYTKDEEVYFPFFEKVICSFK